MKLLRALPGGRFLANSAAPDGSLATHCQLMFCSACSLARPSGNCWIQQLPEGRAREQALQNISWQWVASDPSGAAEFAKNLPPGSARNNFMNNVASQWANNDPKAALAWAANLAAGKERDQAYSA